MNTGEKVMAAIRARGNQLKPEGAGKWRCNSPLRAGSDSLGFTLVIEGDGEHGAYNDFVTGESGSLYELAEKLGVDVPKSGGRAQVDNSKRDYRDLADYAALKGVPLDVFTAAGWINEVKHDYSGRPYIEYATKTGNRWRYLDTKGNPFTSPNGYKRCWYGLKRAVEKANAVGAPLIMVNGEPSVVVGQHFGIPAFAMTGGENGSIPPELMSELKSAWQGEIVIALDCDLAGRKGTAKYAGELTAAGYTAHAIDLGLSDKGDVADFCKLHTADSLPNLLALRNKPAPKAAPETTPVTELANAIKELTLARKRDEAKAPDVALLLDKVQIELDAARRKVAPAHPVAIGEIVTVQRARLAEAIRHPNEVQGLRSHIQALDLFVGGFAPGRVHTIYGDTGMGKTTLAISIVSAMINQAPGLIVPTEITPGAWLDKLVAYRTTVASDRIETGRLDAKERRAVNMAYKVVESSPAFILSDLAPRPAELGALIREGVKQHGWQWVLFDSVSRMSATDASAQVYERVTEIADFTQEVARSGLVVIQTSQVGRNLKDRANKIPQINDALGSGAVEQNSDVVLTLYNHQKYVLSGDAEEDEENFPAGTVAVICAKHRWRGNVEGSAIQLAFRGGIGMYDK